MIQGLNPHPHATSKPNANLTHTLALTRTLSPTLRPYPNANPHPYPNPDPHPNPNAHPHPDPNADPNPDPDPDLQMVNITVRALLRPVKEELPKIYKELGEGE